MTALSDAFPVLLAPMRVETRFTATELLVRVFPDEWAVDKFEAKPTAAEIAAIDAYWTARWAAGGRAAALAAAWQELATRIPPGRAAWLLRGRTPANPAEEPAGVAVGAVVLVIRSATAPAANDRQPSITYWTAVWRAHGDRPRLRQADAALVAAVGTARANAIRAKRPFGVDGALTTPNDDVLVAFLVLAPPAAGSTATDAWTQGARARLLPDHFQFLGFNAGGQVVSVTGAAIPATLAVSPDPAAADQITVNEQTGVLHVPDDLRWLDRLRPGHRRRHGGTDPAHRRDPRRSGTPRRAGTARTGGAHADRGRPHRPDQPPVCAARTGSPCCRRARRPTTPRPYGPARTRRTRQPPRCAPPAGPPPRRRETGRHGPTAAWLAELLGLDPGVLTGMPNADGTDQRDARAANAALWPATWGYFLQTALHPLLGPDAVAQTRDFFLKYVSGRGPLPTVKIGRQPYGIMPTTAFSRLTWPDCRRPHRKALQQGADRGGQGLGGRRRARAAPRRRRERPAPAAARHPRAAPDVGRVPPAVRPERRGPLQPREPRRAGRYRPVHALDQLGHARPGAGSATRARLAGARRSTRTCCAGCSPTCSSRCWPRSSTTGRCPRPTASGRYTDDGRNYLQLAGRARPAPTWTASGWSRASPRAPARRRCCTCCSGTRCMLGWAEAARALAVTDGRPTRSARRATRRSSTSRCAAPAGRVQREPLPAAVLGRPGDHRRPGPAAGRPHPLRAGPAPARPQRARRAGSTRWTCWPHCRPHGWSGCSPSTSTWPPTGWTRGGSAWPPSGSASCASVPTAPRSHGLHLGAYGWLEDIGRTPRTWSPSR